MRWWSGLLVTVVVTAVVPCVAAADPTGSADIVCPATVAVEQKPVAVLDGWHVTSGAPTLELMGVEVYDGPLSENASLVPEQKKGRRELTSTWRFPAARPRDFWLACVYGSSAVRLSRAIPTETSRCVAVHELDARTGRATELKRVTCSR
jgi:hypothetical protein